MIVLGLIVLAALAVAGLLAYVAYKSGAKTAAAGVAADKAAIVAQLAAIKAEASKIEAEGVTDAKAVIARIKALL